MNAPGLAELVNISEVEALECEYGPGQRWHAVVEMEEANFFYWWRKIVEKANRRGEVVFAIQRPNGDVLVHTKSIYPVDLFRLPTGGIFPAESVLEGLQRETYEETGLTPAISRYLGMISYEFMYRGQRLFFASYVFLLRSDDTPPQPQDQSESITGMRYVSLEELKTISAGLRRLPAGWGGWGEFRAPPHDMVIEALESELKLID